MTPFAGTVSLAIVAPQGGKIFTQCAASGLFNGFTKLTDLFYDAPVKSQNGIII